MAYEVIARKWRPQTFDEVVGQDAITQTLRNAVAQERLHHAYLFTGARGVGKTTTARILAKSLNCRTGVTATPCGVCPSCVEIAAGGSLDVIEIDAASHTGVDNIRDVVITSVGIAPARDRYKVFIVDEVHQLSAAAFNALLKTLEEPPTRVVFILATTELHKVPDTIASRCQLYEFRTIPLSKIQSKLAEIASSMKVEVTPAALAAIARAGEGSMRDAQSALDQVIAFAGDAVDVPDVATSLGIVGDETLYDTIDAISTGDAAAVLRAGSRLAESGHDLRNFTRQMMRAVRNLLVTRAVGYDAELVDAAEADAPRVTDLASRFTEAELVRAFSLLAALEQDIRRSADPRFQLEIGLVRLAELPRLRPLAEIIERLEQLESRLGGSAPGPGSGSPAASAGPATAPPRSRSAPPASSVPSTPPAPKPSAVRRESSPPPEPPPFFDDDPPADAKPAVHLDGPDAVAAIRSRLESKNKMMALNALDAAAEITIAGAQLVVRFSDEQAKVRNTLERTRALIETVAHEVTGRTIRVTTVVGGSGTTPEAEAATGEPEAPPRESAATAAAGEASASPSDPIVQAVIDTFQGRLLAFDPPPDES